MKKKGIRESNSVVSGVVGFLSDKGKINLLPSVAQELDEMVEESKHANEIILKSAVSMTSDQVKRLRTIVCRYLGRDLPIKNIIDKNIVGGFSLRVGDFFLDASIASELSSIRQILKS